MQSMWVNVSFYELWAALPVLFAVLALRPVSAKELSRFSWRYSLEITSETAPAMTRSVRRGRTARLSGAALGLSIYPLLGLVGIGIPSQSLFYGLAGYLIGAFMTAVLPGAAENENRTASLVPRTLSDYLPRTALFIALAAVAISGTAALVYEFEPHRVFADQSGSLTALPVSAIAVLIMLLGIRAVVSRPQPLSTPALVAVDDALRTQAVHTLAGVGVSIALFGAGSCLIEMGGHASAGWLHTLGIVTGLCALVGAFWAISFRGAPWRVRRSMLQ